jgi:broad specificity phosphatase PhoE
LTNIFLSTSNFKLKIIIIDDYQDRFTDRLVLIRHGEALANQLQLVAGQQESPLTERGKHQAWALQSALEHLEWDCCVSSDLQRAQDTLEELMITNAVKTV